MRKIIGLICLTFLSVSNSFGSAIPNDATIQKTFNEDVDLTVNSVFHMEFEFSKIAPSLVEDVFVVKTEKSFSIDLQSNSIALELVKRIEKPIYKYNFRQSRIRTQTRTKIIENRIVPPTDLLIRPGWQNTIFNTNLFCC